MADTKTTLTWLLKDEVSGKAAKVSSKLGDVEEKAKKSGGALGKLGGSLGGLVSPLGLATLGVGALTGFLVGAVKAAIDEEKNIVKLDAALKANVEGWDGNRDAIEGVIAERENLAFSDDALRASMSTLVTSTGDVNAALDLQAIAMDLARAKGVDLETASIAVAKASQGSTKELKAMGLEIDDTATASENLARISQATAGQAEAYAGTMAGKWEVLQGKMGNLVEDVGSELLPILMELMDFALKDLVPAISAVAKTFTDIAREVNKAIRAIHEFFRVGEYGTTHFEGGVTVRGGLRGYAHGGTTQPGWAMVGEQGPEMVRFAGGQHVYTASQTAAMAQGGGQPVIVSVQVDGREIGRVVDARLGLIYSGATGARS